MYHINLKPLLKFTLLLLLAAVTGLALFWIWRHAARPARTAVELPVAQGVTYRRLMRDIPRRLMIHVLEMDLRTPGLTFFATPPEPWQGHDLRASTVSEFLTRHHLIAAINADSFSPWEPGAFLFRDHYPHSGDPVTAAGVTVSSGRAYGDSAVPRPRLCLLQSNPATGVAAVITEGALPSSTAQAVTGLFLLVRDGTPAPVQLTTGAAGALHPRTAAGLSKDGRRLWWVVVDGRQRSYSEGVTVAELVAFMIELGAWTALNFDGGGSSAMVIAGPAGRAQVLNSPIHTGLPGRERPVANHLGVRSSPVP